MKKVNRFTSRVTDERQLRAELGFFWEAVMMAMRAVARRSAGRTTTAFESKKRVLLRGAGYAGIGIKV